MAQKKIVNQFEDFKISLSAISKLAEINTERSLPVFNINHNPRTVANRIREILYPAFNPNARDFLKSLITSLAERNILVFEFVETWNKKDKANIDGFYLSPNVIVLKRHQASFKREIFTLIHELGHYLLNEEEIEELDINNFANHNISRIERWCNDFAYFFLAGDYHNLFENINKADGSNDYQIQLIENISAHTHLSKLALFTKLLFQNKLSQTDYRNIRSEEEENYRLRQEQINRQKEIDKLNGTVKRGSIPKPINSPLLISTIQTAFYEGIINEYDVCKTLNISPDKLDRYLQ